MFAAKEMHYHISSIRTLEQSFLVRICMLNREPERHEATTRSKIRDYMRSTMKQVSCNIRTDGRTLQSHKYATRVLKVTKNTPSSLLHEKHPGTLV